MAVCMRRALAQKQSSERTRAGCPAADSLTALQQVAILGLVSRERCWGRARIVEPCARALPRGAPGGPRGAARHPSGRLPRASLPLRLRLARDAERGMRRDTARGERNMSERHIKLGSLKEALEEIVAAGDAARLQLHLLLM